MTIQNLITNGGFETGTLSPWSGVNATITNQYSHSGFFQRDYLKLGACARCIYKNSTKTIKKQWKEEKAGYISLPFSIYAIVVNYQN